MTFHRARRIAAASLFIIAIGCGGKDGVFDDDDIADDIEDRTVQELYKEADKQKFDPPNARLTEEQVAKFVRVATLARRIETIAGKQLDDKADSASRDDDRFSRMATAFSAVGTMRAVVTAELRASIMLDVNPHEYQWIAGKIAATSTVVHQLDEYDARIKHARKELDAATDASLRARRQMDYDMHKDARATFQSRLSAIDRGNAELVERHRDELIPHVRSLKKQAWY